METHKLILIALGVLLIVVGIFLFNALRTWAIIALIVGIIAILRGVTLKSSKEERKKEAEETENEEEITESEEEIIDTENEEDSTTEDETEEDTEILGMKVKPGIHTKLLKKVEPSVEALKPMVFWPFVSKPTSKEENQQKQKMEFKYCKECGARMLRTAKVCGKCGK